VSRVLFEDSTTKAQSDLHHVTMAVAPSRKLAASSICAAPGLTDDWYLRNQGGGSSARY